MAHSWKILSPYTKGKKFLIQKVRLLEDNITLEGDFQPPPLAELSMDDQIFVAAFIKTHGSIKQMESIFGISYPTVKNRLNAIASQIDIIDVKVDIQSSLSQVLDKLEQGEINIEQALKEFE